MSNGNGHHWSKFSWRDWQKDVALRSCSLGARGFWLECLAAMHDADPVGYLTFNGRPATLKQMATNANCSIKEAERFFGELEEAGVFSRAENGIVFSRRMVRDAQASDIGREHAGKRWRTPNGGANGDPNGSPNRDPNAIESEVEKEKEREAPLTPHAVGGGTPAEPGTPPPRRVNGTNAREKGTNPRETGKNRRASDGGRPWSASFTLLRSKGLEPENWARSGSVIGFGGQHVG